MSELHLTMSHAPASGGPEPEPLTVGEMLRRSASLWPDRPALRELGPDGAFARCWTYAELLRDAERLGRALTSRHAPGARVAVYANNIPEWVLFEFGCAFAGLVLVTVNPVYTRRELLFVLQQSGAEGIYYVNDFGATPLGANVAAICGDLPDIKHRILLTDHTALFEGAELGVLRQPKPRDPAQIQYTSGTTGFPKGALLHHHGLVRNAIDNITDAGARTGTRFILSTPLFHTSGCGVQVLGGLGVGATIFLPPSFDPAMYALVIERERLQLGVWVPTMMLAMMDEAERTGRDLSSIEHIMCGGATVSPEFCRKAWDKFGAHVQIVYGQTEASPALCRTLASDAIEDRTQTVGRPLPHTEISIRDPRTNVVLPVGAQGEICARGYQVMLGYHEDPAATEAAIDAEGWLHTGDLGSMDERGYLRVTGRVKEMIIRGGENLFPVEIENALLEHEAITQVAVVGIPDEHWGEKIACFMRHAGGAKPTNPELKVFIRERLSPQKTPQHWVWVEQWPLTGSGKIQKFKLREDFLAGVQSH